LLAASRLLVFLVGFGVVKDEAGLQLLAMGVETEVPAACEDEEPIVRKSLLLSLV
jgi:hypothetical protein